ncbi:MULTISPECIES: inorganic diphosphatase [Niastella]|uniref:inorganic diphosphatase n=1 Tax=Niastella soli TaxID=2821487 RepID=A0ABS3Z2H2_9BACT|nr:inorganic diphosphatase [Niastella soli]MBO9204353.1 inorganic diphosphatase [Niastella soli]
MQTIEVVIESPRATQAKYKYDPKQKIFILKRLLPLGMVFPYDFGFIPGTLGEDGDPLDALVLSEFASFTGAHLTCRIIGALKAVQGKEGKKAIRNDRYFCVPAGSITYSTIDTIDQLGKEHHKQIEEFFINYNKVDGKVFSCLGTVDAEKAFKMIRKGKE